MGTMSGIWSYIIPRISLTQVRFFIPRFQERLLWIP